MTARAHCMCVHSARANRDGPATVKEVRAAVRSMVADAHDANDRVVFVTSSHGSGDGYGNSYLCLLTTHGSFRGSLDVTDPIVGTTQTEKSGHSERRKIYRNRRCSIDGRGSRAFRPPILGPRSRRRLEHRSAWPEPGAHLCVPRCVLQRWNHARTCTL